MSPDIDADSTDDRIVFLKKMIEKADLLPDVQFYSLSDDLKDWLNKNITLLANGKPPKDFPDYKGSIAKKKKEIEDRAVAAHKGLRKETRYGKKLVGLRVKELLLEYGVSSDYDLISKRLQKENLKISKQTFQAIRYEFKQTLAILKYHGHLKPQVGGY